MIKFSLFTFGLFFCLVLAYQADGQTKAGKKDRISSLFDDLPIDDPRENSQLRENEDATEKIRKNIIAITTINKTKCYKGEPLLLTQFLYSRLYSESSIKKRPALFGFFITEIDQKVNEPVLQKKIQGLNYREFVIQRLQLIPFQEGDLSIEGVAIDNEVTYKKNNGKEYKYEGIVSSNDLKIKVAALPLQGKPGNFSGLVGSYSLSAKAQSTNSTTGASNKLIIEIKGNGTLTDSVLPLIEWPDGFEAFPPGDHFTTDTKSYPAISSRNFEIPFVARKAGNFVIPEIMLNFFDPSKKAYQTVATQAIQLKIEPGIEHRPSTTINRIDREKISLPKYLIAIFILGILITIAILSFSWFRKKSTPIPFDVPVIPPVTEITTPSIADRVKELDNITDGKSFLVEFKKSLLHYLGNKIGDPSLDEDRLILKIGSQENSFSNEVKLLYNDCNLWLYAPIAISPKEKQDMTQRFMSLLKAGGDA